MNGPQHQHRSVQEDHRVGMAKSNPSRQPTPNNPSLERTRTSRSARDEFGDQWRLSPVVHPNVRSGCTL